MLRSTELCLCSGPEKNHRQRSRETQALGMGWGGTYFSKAVGKFRDKVKIWERVPKISATNCKVENSALEEYRATFLFYFIFLHSAKWELFIIFRCQSSSKSTVSCFHSGFVFKIQNDFY